MTSDQANSETATDAAEPAPQADNVLGDLVSELVALRAYTAHLVVAALDLAGAQVRHYWQQLLIAVAIGVLGLFLAVTFVLYLVRGIDGGLTAALHSDWLGHLMTGGLGLAILAGFVKWSLIRAEHRRRAIRMAQFEERKASQREQVGHDVDDAGHVPQ